MDVDIVAGSAGLVVVEHRQRSYVGGDAERDSAARVVEPEERVRDGLAAGLAWEELERVRRFRKLDWCTYCVQDRCCLAVVLRDGERPAAIEDEDDRLAESEYGVCKSSWKGS
jgi:hypothetical protein